jgi:hypothetical protein
MEKGGTIKGHLVDIHTGKSPQLGKGEMMQISTNDPSGVSYHGMNHADVQPDGSFTLLVPAGQNHLGMYFGPNWRGVNTDQLFDDGVAVVEGQVLELEIRVERRMQKPNRN